MYRHIHLGNERFMIQTLDPEERKEAVKEIRKMCLVAGIQTPFNEFEQDVWYLRSCLIEIRSFMEEVERGITSGNRGGALTDIDCIKRRLEYGLGTTEMLINCFQEDK